jgi:hypothetical protein
VLDADDLHSRARNTPFEGRKFQGRAQMTFVGRRARLRPRQGRGKLMFDLDWTVARNPYLAAAIVFGYLLGSIPFG